MAVLTLGINQLLARTRLRILRGADGAYVYQEVAADEAAKCAVLPPPEPALVLEGGVVLRIDVTAALRSLRTEVLT